ncbi:phosphomannomutase 2 [Amanita muscaria]
MSAFADRPIHKLILFDVDDTLTPARQPASQEMIDVLRALRKKFVIGFVGGSDLVKISEQLAVGGSDGMIRNSNLQKVFLFLEPAACSDLVTEST